MTRRSFDSQSEKTIRVAVDKMTLAGVLVAIVVWQILPAIVDAVVTIAR